MNCDHSLQIQSYLDGELHGAAAEAAERHLQSCAICQALAAETANQLDVIETPAARASIEAFLTKSRRKREP